MRLRIIGARVWSGPVAHLAIMAGRHVIYRAVFDFSLAQMVARLPARAHAEHGHGRPSR